MSSSSSANNPQNLSPLDPHASSERSDRLTERLTEQRPVDRIKQEREEPPGSGYGQQAPRDIREPPPPQPPMPQDNKPWGYAGIELMNTGAAFWQNYSGEYLTDFCEGRVKNYLNV